MTNIDTPERAGRDVGKLILSRVPVSSKIKHYKDADGVEHYDMENTNHNGQTHERKRVLTAGGKDVKVRERDISELPRLLSPDRSRSGILMSFCAPFDFV